MMQRFATVVSVLLLASPAAGQFDSGSDGSDGALDCAALFAMNPDCTSDCDTACTVEINLGQAATASWDTPSPDPGKGVYDAQQWAVVYKYTSIDIPANVTVTFVNHRKGAPVVWLARDDVTITGRVELNGADGSIQENSRRANPGPGGFSGGIGRVGGSGGFGPGGGGWGNNGGGGGYGTRGTSTDGAGGEMYGTASIDPLIGGSGGGADFNPLTGGGAGGGAILIAATGIMTLNGGIFATGGGGLQGGGSGSGGGIRLIANDISGPGMLRALGGTLGADGGDGRIRVEAPDPDQDIHLDPTMPLFTEGPSPEFVFPAAPPILRVTSLTVTPMIEKSVPTDPLATVATDDVAFAAAPGAPVTINIQALNFPQAEGMIVLVRLVQADGGLSEVRESTPLLDDDNGGLVATAEFNFGDFARGKWEVQLSVELK